MDNMLNRQFIVDHYDSILELINTIKIGLFIADGNANVIMLNKDSEKIGELSFAEIVGKNMSYLEDVGYVDESCILKALKTKDEYTMVQRCKGGEYVYNIATPFFNDDGNVEFVICTERDITEIKELEILLTESKKLAIAQKKQLEYLQKRESSRGEDIVAVSKKMQELLQTAKRVAKVSSTVMLTGESGTGKEIVANYIYENSGRTGKPFIKINCASLPDNLLESELFGYEGGAFTGANPHGNVGIFELANGGTLFLDEISEISISIQAKLLRVLQEKEIRRIGGKDATKVDVRIIVATNTNIKQAVEEGRFREDLYYRLNVVPISIPPLRERKDDIKPLIEHFLKYFNQQHGTHKQIDSFAVRILENAEWKGNVRELRNAIERLMVCYDGLRITVTQVERLLRSCETTSKTSSYASGHNSLKEYIEGYEKEILEYYIEQHGTANKAAKELGVAKSTMSRKLNKYRILKNDEFQK